MSGIQDWLLDQLDYASALTDSDKDKRVTVRLSSFDHDILERLASNLRMTKTGCAEMLMAHVLHEALMAMEEFARRVEEYQGKLREQQEGSGKDV